MILRGMRGPCGIVDNAGIKVASLERQLSWATTADLDLDAPDDPWP
jgi:hypothetical protein